MSFDEQPEEDHMECKAAYMTAMVYADELKARLRSTESALKAAMDRIKFLEEAVEMDQERANRAEDATLKALSQRDEMGVVARQAMDDVIKLRARLAQGG